MKTWSLGAKLTAWSALVSGVAVLLCGVGAGWFVQQEEMEFLDDQPRNEAAVFFGGLRQHGKAVDWSDMHQVKQMLPVTRTGRFVEVADPNGKRLYRSKNLGNHYFTGVAPGMRRVSIGNQSARLGIFNEGGVTLYLAASLNEINADAKELAFGFLIELALLLTTVTIGGWWIARKALAPIREITVAAERITSKHLGQRLPVPRTQDEIARLASVLNEMFDRLDVSFRQAERFSADASHELKTPLTILRVSIEDLLESPALNEHAQRRVASLLEQTHRLSGIIQRLLLLSRADAGRLEIDLAECDIVEIIMACIEDARIVAESSRIAITADLPDHIRAVVDAGRLAQILVNLLENAVQYNHDDGIVRVSVELSGDATLELRVANTGPGIPPEHAQHLFERFFRSNLDSRVPGHGLGLSLARELARAHGGDLVLERSDSEWTQFKLTLSLPLDARRENSSVRATSLEATR